MALKWKRCTALVAAGITATMLAACGSSTVESAISPQRFITFGDGTADIGQTGTRYTVNGADGILNWTEQVTSNYGQGITAAANGGLAYAQGNARIVATPDAAGNSSTPTVARQIDQFLQSNQFSSTDMVLISAGISDVIVQAQAALAGDITRDEALVNVRAAGEALSEEVQRLIDAGARYIVVAGTYRLGQGSWGIALNEEGFLDALSSRFNEGFKIAAVNKAENVLFVDFEYYVNNFYNRPGYFGFSNSKSPVCNSIDDGPGIGTGSGQVNSALCTTSTVVDSNFNSYAFADRVYLTPYANREFGNWTYDTIRDRW